MYYQQENSESFRYNAYTSVSAFLCTPGYFRPYFFFLNDPPPPEFSPFPHHAPLPSPPPAPARRALEQLQHRLDAERARPDGVLEKVGFEEPFHRIDGLAAGDEAEPVRPAVRYEQVDVI